MPHTLIQKNDELSKGYQIKRLLITWGYLKTEEDLIVEHKQIKLQASGSIFERDRSLHISDF